MPPTGKFTVSLMLPDPDAAHEAPLDATQVHVAPLSALGNVSETVAPVAADGPAFDATIVYVTDVPGTSVAEPSVFEMARSVAVFSVVVSIALLFVEVGSVTPLGTETVAVFDNTPDAVGEMFAVRVYVAVEPTARLTVSLMLPVPLAAHVAPDVATQVQVAPVSEAGSESATVAPTRFDGPALDATIVYVMVVPAESVTWPSVLVMDRSAFPLRVSVSVAELLPGVGSVRPPGIVAVAVLTSVPVAFAAMLAVSVKVAVAPTGRFTEALMLPVPLAGQEPPPAPTQVHVAPLSALGSVSATVRPVTADGPAFDATIAYVTGVPGISEIEPSFFVMETSAVGLVPSTSVAELLPGVGSVVPEGTATVTVFEMFPDELAETVAFTV